MSSLLVGAVRPAAGWAELAALAWRRSWHFTGAYRRSTRAGMDAARSWSWQWVLVGWQAAAQFPAQLVAAGVSAGEIWTLGPASARVHRTDRRRPLRIGGLLLASCAALALIAVLAAAVAAALLTGAFLVVVGLLAVWVAGLAVTAARPDPASAGRLARQARQLTAGPAVVVSDVVVGRQRRGDGSRLMRALQEHWKQEGVAVAVLQAGSDDLVAFYRDVVGGWTVDGDSGRRMIWTGGGHR